MFHKAVIVVKNYRSRGEKTPKSAGASNGLPTAGWHQECPIQYSPDDAWAVSIKHAKSLTILANKFEN